MMHSGGFGHRASLYRWLQERFHFIHGGTSVLERNLNIPDSSRFKLCHNRFSIGDGTVERSLLRAKDRFIFAVVVAAIPIGVDVVGEGNRDHKLTGIMALQLTQSIAAKGDRVDRRSCPKVDLDPAVRASADPTAGRPITTVIHIRRIHDIPIPRHCVFCDSGSCQSIPLVSHVASPVELGPQAQWPHVTFLTGDIHLLRQSCQHRRFCWGNLLMGCNKPRRTTPTPKDQKSCKRGKDQRHEGAQH